MQFSFFSKQRLLKGTLGVWGLFPTEASCGRVGWKKLPAVASGGKNAPFRPTRNEAKFRSERREQRVTLRWAQAKPFSDRSFLRSRRAEKASCGRVGRKKLPAVASGGKNAPFRPTRSEAKFRSERPEAGEPSLGASETFFRPKLPAVASGGKSSLRSRRAEKAPCGRVGRKKLPVVASGGKTKTLNKPLSAPAPQRVHLTNPLP